MFVKTRGNHPKIEDVNHPAPFILIHRFTANSHPVTLILEPCNDGFCIKMFDEKKNQVFPHACTGTSKDPQPSYFHTFHKALIIATEYKDLLTRDYSA